LQNEIGTKAARKMFAKFNFVTNILRAAFVPISLCQKLQA